jgi:hypothetical protein
VWVRPRRYVPVQPVQSDDGTGTGNPVLLRPGTAYRLSEPGQVVRRPASAWSAPETSGSPAAPPPPAASTTIATFAHTFRPDASHACFEERVLRMADRIRAKRANQG